MSGFESEAKLQTRLMDLLMSAVEVLVFPTQAGVAGSVAEQQHTFRAFDLPLLGLIVELDAGGPGDFQSPQR